MVSKMEIAKLMIQAVSGILVPVAIVIAGYLIKKQQQSSARAREIAEKKVFEARKHAERVSLLVKHIASSDRNERLLAIHLLKHLRDEGGFPSDLVEKITIIAGRDTPEVAGASLIEFGENPDLVKHRLLFEVLAPVRIHLDRTRDAFSKYSVRNEVIESLLKESNQYIRDLLISKQYLIPEELDFAAKNLVRHYDAWLSKYDRVYQNGVRDPNEPFIFVGTDGIPFPPEAESKFLKCFDEMRKWYQKKYVHTNHTNSADEKSRAAD
jgi:hypothetical protein